MERCLWICSKMNISAQDNLLPQNTVILWGLINVLATGFTELERVW